jgi:alpha-glucosidase
MNTDSTTTHEPTRWPEGAVVYHIYPRSLQDSNGDGIGDLPGITARLEYFKGLHITAIWLSPFYPSPMADFGYDIADYCDVDPMFGTLDDFRKLLTEAHKLDIKVIIDLVPNHTSDDHEWFKQSCKSKDNPYSNWYIWRDAKSFSETGEPEVPNNWRDALTGGSAWEWDEQREQFYLHSFDVRQPDLNWSNQEVRSAIQDVMRFWLDLGVDGFRVDAVYWMAKEPLLHDDGINPDYVEGEDLKYDAVRHNNSRGWPAVYAYLTEMADVLKEPKYQDKLRFMITEAYPERHNPLAAYLGFYVGVDPKVAAPFNFEGVSLPWEAAAWHRFLKSFHHALEQFSNYCIPSYAFGNHDQPRLIDRLDSVDAARSAAVLLLTLPGMAFIYYGEELGMRNVHIPDEFVQDPAAKGDPLRGIGRDPERTPMQWTPGKHAGFTEGSKTWLPVADDYKQINVETESADPSSFLSLYRTLATLRAEHDTLKSGQIEVLDLDSDHIVGYRRHTEKESLYVFINFSGEPASFTLADVNGQLEVSSHPHTACPKNLAGTMELSGHEAVVYRAQ